MEFVMPLPVFALITDGDQHALVQAASTIASLALFFVLTRQQTRKLIGDPKKAARLIRIFPGQRLPEEDEITLAAIAARVCNIEGSHRHIALRVDGIETSLEAHLREDADRFTAGAAQGAETDSKVTAIGTTVDGLEKDVGRIKEGLKGVPGFSVADESVPKDASGSGPLTFGIC